MFAEDISFVELASEKNPQEKRRLFRTRK